MRDIFNWDCRYNISDSQLYLFNLFLIKDKCESLTFLSENLRFICGVLCKSNLRIYAEKIITEIVRLKHFSRHELSDVTHESLNRVLL